MSPSLRKIKAKSKVKAIVRHYLQQKSPLRAGQPTLRNARTLTQNDNRASADSNETDEIVNDDFKKMNGPLSNF